MTDPKEFIAAPFSTGMTGVYELTGLSEPELTAMFEYYEARIRALEAHRNRIRKEIDDRVMAARPNNEGEGT